jgi:citrate/tricarballylate utilization protein
VQNIATALLLAAAFTLALLGATFALNGGALRAAGGDFYAVIPHAVLVTLFGGVGLFVVIALAIGSARCRRDLAAATPPPDKSRQRSGVAGALRDAFTLRHLHVGDAECVTALEVRTPWRKRMHHLTLYGFALCFASTCVATLYHFAGYPAPYAYTSLPVLLGTVGGVALVIGTAGLLRVRRARDPALSHASQDKLDGAFITLLLLTGGTGLALLALREHAAMGVLLIVHLGIVLALFATLPYGKFVHGLYRLAALVKFRREQA